MKTVQQLLEDKGREIWHIGPDATVYDAVRLMAEKGVGALLVMENDRLVGIVSERDYARQVILKGRASRETPVSEIMTSRVVASRPDQQISSCLALMTEKRIRHMPVMRDDAVIGVVSIGDLVKAIIADQQATIEHLQHYITG